jgi:hypothetical protein
VTLHSRVFLAFVAIRCSISTSFRICLCWLLLEWWCLLSKSVLLCSYPVSFCPGKLLQHFICISGELPFFDRAVLLLITEATGRLFSEQGALWYEEMSLPPKGACCLLLSAITSLNNCCTMLSKNFCSQAPLYLLRGFSYILVPAAERVALPRSRA